MHPRSTRPAYDAIADQWHNRPRQCSSRTYVVGLIEVKGFRVERWEVDDPSSRGHSAVLATRV